MEVFTPSNSRQIRLPDTDNAFITINKNGVIHLSAGTVKLLELNAMQKVIVLKPKGKQFMIARSINDEGFSLRYNGNNQSMMFNCKLIVIKLAEYYQLDIERYSERLYVDQDQVKTEHGTAYKIKRSK